MSSCERCDVPMDDIEAQQWFTCRKCRKEHGYEKVPKITRKGADERGRPQRNLKTLGGKAEMNTAGDDL